MRDREVKIADTNQQHGRELIERVVVTSDHLGMKTKELAGG
jgi:hypothetical protein